MQRRQTSQVDEVADRLAGQKIIDVWGLTRPCLLLDPADVLGQKIERAGDDQLVDFRALEGLWNQRVGRLAGRAGRQAHRAPHHSLGQAERVQQKS